MLKNYLLKSIVTNLLSSIDIRTFPNLVIKWEGDMEENGRVSKPGSSRGQYYEREISKERFQSQRTNVADLTAVQGSTQLTFT